MTHQPVKVLGTLSIKDAATLMKKQGVGSVLIEENNNVVGIATEKDFVERVIAQDISPQTPIKNIMSSLIKEKTTAPDIDLYDALKTMNQLEIRRLPVMNNGHFVGLLTRKDILKFQPSLFDVIVEKLHVREERRKPGVAIHGEGMCERCQAISQNLFLIDNLKICPRCRV